MSVLAQSSFTRYDQTPQEQLAGTCLTTEQKQFIQTQLANLAEERLALVPDANNYSTFIQQEAHIKGQMQFAQYLLDCSTESETQLLAIAEAQAATS